MTDANHNGPIDTARDAELVASLFATRVPAAVMTILFVMVGTVLAAGARDGWLRTLVVAGIVASAVRIGVVIAGERVVRGHESASPARIRAIERRFAISYLAFATILGWFCARAIVVVPIDRLILVGVLMMGYAAGVASGVTLRPRIAIAAIALAVLPFAAVAALHLGMTGVALATMLVAFLAGGLRSMQMRYRSEIGRIALRRTYERLAACDYMTQIANRLGLEQHYAARAFASPGHPVIVHCLDLDGFKQINDLHGHDVGDALLIAVAQRLGEGPGETVAARLGGDEFVLVRFDLDPARSAQALHALEVRLSAPYRVDGVALTVGVSLGMATGTTDQPLRDLLRDADLRQRMRKMERRRANRPGGSAISPPPVATRDGDGPTALYL